MPAQAKIVSACGVIHNFITIYDPDDQPEPWEAEVAFQGSSDLAGALGTGNVGGAETCRATEARNTIAKAMWLRARSAPRNCSEIPM